VISSKGTEGIYSRLQQEAYSSVGSSRISNYLYNRMSALTASFLLWFSQPSIVQHEGCYIVQDLFDKESFSDWSAKFGEDKSSIESYCNLISIADLFHLGDCDHDFIVFVADALRDSWDCSITKKLNRSIEVRLIYDDIGMPSLTFNVCR
jgi:hypothetical protein